MVYNFIKKETPTQVFSVNFAKVLRTAFFTEHVLWLPLAAGFFETSILKEVRVLRYFH